jgi:thioredoxin 1
MAPVLDELEMKYAGKLVIERVNTKENRQKAQDLGIRMIPTQIFFAPDGKELYRHVGFYPGADIVEKWAELGYKLEGGG